MDAAWPRDWGAETLFLDVRSNVGVAVRLLRVLAVHFFQAGCLKYVMAAMLGAHCADRCGNSRGVRLLHCVGVMLLVCMPEQALRAQVRPKSGRAVLMD